MQLAYSPAMEKINGDELTEVGRPESIRRARRRRKLVALLKEIRAQMGGAPPQDADDMRGAAAVAEQETGTPRTHFVAMVQGRRGLGDDLAKKLETIYRKPPGWFDAEAGAIWPFSLQLQDEVLNLNPEDLHFMEVAMWTHLKKAVPVKLSYMDTDGRQPKQVQKPTTIVSPRPSSHPKTKKSL